MATSPLSFLPGWRPIFRARVRSLAYAGWGIEVAEAFFNEPHRLLRRRCLIYSKIKNPKSSFFNSPSSANDEDSRDSRHDHPHVQSRELLEGFVRRHQLCTCGDAEGRQVGIHPQLRRAGFAGGEILPNRVHTRRFGLEEDALSAMKAS